MKLLKWVKILKFMLLKYKVLVKVHLFYYQEYGDTTHLNVEKFGVSKGHYKDKKLHYINRR